MTTLRVALDASGMIAQARQVADATQAMGQAAQSTGRAMEGLDRNLLQTSQVGEATRETLRTTSQVIQSAGNVRQLVDALKEVDGGFASIANVGAIAAQTILSFARAAEDFRKMSEATGQFSTAMQASATAVQVADNGLSVYGSTAAAVTTAINAEAAATTRAAGATTLFSRATLALRAAWAAHPVLLIGTVLAAAATAMAAFASNTRKATAETDALAEQQRALEQTLKNVQKIRAESVVGQRFGIAGAAETARQREREAVFQQAATVEQGRLQGVPTVPISTLGAAGKPEDIIASRAQLSLRFQQEVQKEIDRLKREASTISTATAARTFTREGGPERVFSPKELQDFQADATKTVRDSFVVGYEEAIQILQGRFDELGASLQQSLTQPAEIEQVQQIRRTILVSGGEPQVPMRRVEGQLPTPMLSQQELNLRAAEDVEAYLRKAEFLKQINAGLAEEARLAALPADEYERALQIVRIKNEAVSAGIELTQQELANIEQIIAAQQGQAQDQRRVEFLGEINSQMEEEARLAQLTASQRQVEIELLRIKQEAMSAGVELSKEELAALQASIAAQQQKASDLQRNQFLGDVNRQLDEEVRLTRLTTSQREVEIQLLRIKEDALQSGVELNREELAGIEQQIRARQRLSQAERQVQFRREVVQPSEENLRLAKYAPDERQIETEIASARAQAEASNLEFSDADAQRIRANMEAQQQLDSLRATGEAVGASLGNAFINAASGVGTLRQALAGLLQDLLRIAAQRAILEPLMNMFGNAFSNLGSTPTQMASGVEAQNLTYSSA